MVEKQRHFLLVHGACHGAWCWYKVGSLLKSAGHKVTVLDLAASGIHPKQVHEIRSFSDYFQPLMELMTSLPAEERVILVGHSLGGLSISISMEMFPEKISVGVFATAFMPGPDLSFLKVMEEHAKTIDSFMDSEYMFDDGPENPPTAFLFGPHFLAAKLYQLSPVEDLNLAIQLMRPICPYNNAPAQDEMVLTKEKYGSVPRVYVVCDEDKAIKEDIQRWMIKNNPTDEVKVIYGSDHMPMFSKPKELFSFLLEIAEKYL